MSVFTLTPSQASDILTFLFFFPTGTRPSVGRQVTVPAGPPPTGSAGDESLIGTLVSIGNLADAGRHCELVATAPGPTRQRSYYLNGGVGTGGSWTTDAAGEPQLTTALLRTSATGPLTLTCEPLGEGARLGADLDEDLHLNGDDCAVDDAGVWAPLTEVTNLSVVAGPAAHLVWDEQATSTRPGVVYEVVGGTLQALRAAGLDASTSCLSGDLTTPTTICVPPRRLETATSI